MSLLKKSGVRKRVQQDHGGILAEEIGREQVLDHVLRAGFDVGVDLRGELRGLREVLLVKRAAVILLDHFGERGQNILVRVGPDGVGDQDFGLFRLGVLLRDGVEERAAGRGIGGQAEHLADLVGGRALRAAVDHAERAVDAERRDEHVFLRVRLADGIEELEALTVQFGGDLLVGGFVGEHGQRDAHGAQGGVKQCFFHGFAPCMGVCFRSFSMN